MATALVSGSTNIVDPKESQFPTYARAVAVALAILVAVATPANMRDAACLAFELEPSDGNGTACFGFGPFDD